MAQSLARCCRSMLLVSIMNVFMMTPVTSILYGLQTSDSTSSYAGSFSYDPDHHVVYLTGTTYGYFWNEDQVVLSKQNSTCYFGILQLPATTADAKIEVKPTWLYKRTLEDTSSQVVESCSSMAILGTKAYLGGWTEPGGLLNNLLATGSVQSVQYGLVLDVNIDLKQQQTTGTATQFLGGKLIQNTRGAQSAVAMAISQLGDILYVASLESDETTVRSDFDATSQDPNFSTGGVQKRGSNFGVSIMLLAPKSATTATGTPQITLTNEHVIEIATSGGIDNIAGMLLLGSETLVLAGSAVGHNTVAIPDNGITGTDHDGFITLINAISGEISVGMRIQSPQVGRDDYIHGICMNPGEDFIYVVGTTKGSFSTRENIEEVSEAFLLKVNPFTFDIIWNQPLNAQIGLEAANIEGLSCAVTSDGLHVYFGGVAKDGATIDAHSSQGRDDIVVAQYITSTGKLVWTEQLGTRGDDYVSDLATDGDGNLLIFGTTDGSYFRQRDGGTNTDVIVFAVARGTAAPHPPIDYSDFATNSPSASSATTPANAVAAPESSSQGKDNSGVIAATVVISVCLFAMACFVWQRKRKRESYPDSGQILEYLRGFDNVEVDLKHSATGGYHGVYVKDDGGPRYYRSGSSLEAVDFSHDMSPLTYDPIVEQALFSMDDDDTPYLGEGGGGGGLKREASNYDGLMDAYNSAWGDLSPCVLPPSPSNSRRKQLGREMFSSRGSLEARSILEDDLMDVNINDAPRGSWGREII